MVEKYLNLGGGADASGCNKKSCYQVKAGEIAGCINVALWHAIGNTVSLTMALSPVSCLMDSKGYRCYLLQGPTEIVCKLLFLRQNRIRAPAGFAQAERNPAFP